MSRRAVSIVLVGTLEARGSVILSHELPEHWVPTEVGTLPEQSRLMDLQVTREKISLRLADTRESGESRQVHLLVHGVQQKE